MNTTSDSFFKVDSRLPATKAQQRVLKLYQLGERFRSIHNIGGIFRVNGLVDPEILQAATQDVMNSHAILRSTFCAETRGQFLNVAAANSLAAPIETLKVASVDSAVLASVFREMIKRPFDIFREPAWRIYHFRTESGQSALMLAIHHLISDYQTVAVVIKEIVYYYELRLGGSPVIYEPAFISDEAAQRRYAEQEESSCARYLADVRERIQGVAPLDLFGKKVGLLQRSFDFDGTQVLIPQALTQRIAAVSDQYGLPASAFYLAAYTILLKETSDQSEFLIGFPVDGRSDKKNLRAAGFLSSPSVLKIKVDSDATMLDLCQDNSREMRRTFRTRFVPLVDSMQNETGEQSAGIQALFSYVNLPPETESVTTISIDRVLTGVARSDLDIWLTILNKNTDLYVMLELSLDLADRTRIKQLVKRYLSLLDSIASNPMASVGSVLPEDHAPGKLGLDIVGSFSIDPLIDPTRFWCAKSGQDTALNILPYQMVLQSLLGVHGDNEASRGFFCLMRPGDFFLNKSGEPTSEDHEALVEDLCRAFSASVARRQIPHFALICPSVETAPHIRTAERSLLKALGDIPGIRCLDLTESCPQDQFFVERERLAHIPYGDDFFDFLAIEIARLTYLARSPAIKVIVLDCDNTLWRGAIGEEGIDGVSLDAGHLALQRKMVELHDAGVLITLSSKNDHEIVESFFQQREDAVLKWQHIAATRISWNSKADGILSLAQEMNLGLDSFLFLDDNPLEIIEVQHRLPEVLCIRVPHDVSILGPFIANLWPLAIEATSVEDRQRTALYQTEAKRNELAQQSLSYADFIAGLHVKVDIHPLTVDNLARACQISQRTNQFNLLSVRYTEQALLSILDSPAHVARLVYCEDRFGSYGDIGLLVARRANSTLEVETFALSCRAMGRGVEIEMLRELGKIGLALQVDSITLNAARTPRNTPAMSFVKALGVLGSGEYDDDSAITRLAATDASQADPNVVSTPSHTQERDAAAVRNTKMNRLREAEQLIWIADHLVLRNHGKLRQSGAATTNHPHEAESAIRAIWTDLLKRPPAKPSETFIEAGLDSLGAVDFVLRIEKQCGVPISLDALYGAQSFSGICALVQGQGHAAGAQEMQAQMFADMSLAYDEVPALINRASYLTVGQAQHVLLTGATGFVGAHLLIELLKISSARIVCLVRCDSEEAGRDKLMRILAKHKLAVPDAVFNRIDILVGNLADSDLELSQVAFSEWAARIDVVIHCGAEVNFYMSYPTLCPSNVHSTRTLLRFCASEKIKPMHFISTIGVFHSRDMSGQDDLPESGSAELISALSTGYQQSKYVAEGLLARARERGMPVSVIRLGTISGSGKTGRMNTSDFLVSLIATAHQIGAMPFMRDLDFLPADFAGKAIAAITNDPKACGKFYNLVHPDALPIREIEDWYATAGKKMQVLPYDDWILTVTQFLEDKPNHHFAVYAPMIATRDGKRSLLNILLTAPKVCSHNTDCLLERAGIKYPPLDQSLFARYLSGYEELGWLPDPATATPDLAEYLMRSPEHLQGYASLRGKPLCDEDYTSAAGTGEANAAPLSLQLVSHIESLARLYEDKRVRVTGTVLCPLLHPAPMTVSHGYWEVPPNDGYRIEDDKSRLFLRYKLNLTDADGQNYVAAGYKVSRDFSRMFFESQTLKIRIYREGQEHGEQVVGRVTFPFAQFFYDQIDAMVFRPDVDEKAADRYKLLWLMFLGKELLGNYLTLGLQHERVSVNDLGPLLKMFGIDRILPERLARLGNLTQLTGFLSDFVQTTSTE